MAIWRIDTCKVEAGYKSQASIYALIRNGLWTKPVRLGVRSVGWPDKEVNAICAARIAGKTEDEIRELVIALHKRRVSALEALGSVS
jgi:prophage regulatory protein